MRGRSEETDRGERGEEVLSQGSDVPDGGGADEVLRDRSAPLADQIDGLTDSQNCRTAPWDPPLPLISLQASKAATSVRRSERDRLNDSRAFLLSSRLSIGEVKRGFADRRAAIVNTACQLRQPPSGGRSLLGSRHLKRAPRTSIFAKRISTGIMLIYLFSCWMITTLLLRLTCLPSAVNRLF